MPNFRNIQHDLSTYAQRKLRNAFVLGLVVLVVVGALSMLVGVGVIRAITLAWPSPDMMSILAAAATGIGAVASHLASAWSLKRTVNDLPPTVLRILAGNIPRHFPPFWDGMQRFF